MNHRGLSLVSTLIAMTIFGLVIAVGARSFQLSSQSWSRVSSANECSVGLRRAAIMIQADFAQTSRERVATKPGPSTLSGFDGDAFWCLSAQDSEGNFSRDSSHSPFWQKTILYYTIVPKSPEVTALGASGVDSAGYENHCPYKVLIRKEIDWGTPTNPADSETAESLMSADDLVPYLTRPVSGDLSSMSGEPGLKSVEVVSRNLLTVRTQFVAPDLQVELLGVELERARKEPRFGSIPLTDSSSCQTMSINLNPKIERE